MQTILDKHLNEVYETLTLLDKEEIDVAVGILLECRSRNGMVWVCGNGGSAATSAHLANDLTKAAGIRAVDMAGMTSTVTAYGNDNGWKKMYSDLLDMQMLGGDVVIGITCGGNSPNVVDALEYASLERGADVICLTGNSLKSDVHKVPDVAFVHAPANDIRVQEDVHMVVCHAMTRAVADAWAERK